MRFALGRKLLLLAFLVLLSGLCAAQKLDVTGTVSVKLDQRTFEAGEELQAEITVSNSEPFPIAEAYLIVELVQGGKFYYPSQISDADNVFFEQKISGINLAPTSSKKISFSYVLPANLDTDTYRLDVYFKNAKTFIEGIPHLFLGPHSINFTVFGKGDFPQAKIVRTKTKFNGYAGQIGAKADPGSVIEGSVFVQNNSSKDLTNLRLIVSLCEWDDTACTKNESQKTAAIDSLKAKEEKELQLQLDAPSLPSAYAIKIELQNSAGKTLSLFRNRVIVVGATKKIHQLFVNNYHFKPNEKVELNALIGPSPDHYTNAVLDGASLALSVKDLDSGSTVFSKSIALVEEEDFFKKKADFTTKTELKNFEVCGAITKGETVFDSYCFNMRALLFAETQKSSIRVDWHYNADKKVFSLNFCSLSPTLLAVPIEARYYLQKEATTIASDAIKADGCVRKEIAGVSIGKYELIVNNLQTGRQSTEEIDLVEYVKSCANISCDDANPCTEDSCTAGQCSHSMLADATSCGPGKVCQAEKCVKGDTPTVVLAQVFWPLVVLVITIILMAFVYFSLKSKRRGF